MVSIVSKIHVVPLIPRHSFLKTLVVSSTRIELMTYIDLV